MKPTKIIPAFIFIFILSSALNAANPIKDKADEMSTKAIERINMFVALDSNQNIAFKIKAKTCYLKMEEAKTKTDKQERMRLTQNASKEFRTSLDSILTIEQKEQLEAKKKANKDAIMAKNSNKKQVK